MNSNTTYSGKKLKSSNGIYKRRETQIVKDDPPFKVSKNFLASLSKQEIYFEDDQSSSEPPKFSSQKILKLKEIKKKIALLKKRRKEEL
jgi:hypothetical protein